MGYLGGSLNANDLLNEKVEGEYQGSDGGQGDGKARAYPQAKPLRKRRAERCECLDSLPWHCETILPCCTQMRCGLHRNTV